jgi:hypothetical protein
VVRIHSGAFHISCGHTVTQAVWPLPFRLPGSAACGGRSHPTKCKHFAGAPVTGGADAAALAGEGDEALGGARASPHATSSRGDPDRSGRGRSRGRGCRSGGRRESRPRPTALCRRRRGRLLWRRRGRSRAGHPRGGRQPITRRVAGRDQVGRRHCAGTCREHCGSAHRTRDDNHGHDQRTAPPRRSSRVAKGSGEWIRTGPPAAGAGTLTRAETGRATVP